jgi:hypothetical protein
MHPKLPSLALFVVCLIALSLTVGRAQEGQVRLVWEPPTTHVDGTPATELKGYNLYYWQSNWDLPESVDVGNQTTYTLTALEVDQTYHFAVTAYDVGGNESVYSNIVSTTIASSSPPPDAEAPTVAMTAPVDGSFIMGSPITVSATAFDNVAVGGVQFLLDGVNLEREDTTAPYSIAWDTTTVADGVHSLAARARDAAGNQTTSGAVTVTIKNLPPPPSDTVGEGLTDAGGVIAGTEPGPSATEGDSLSDGSEVPSVDPQPAILFEISTPKDGDILTGNAVGVAVSDVPAGTASVLFQAIPSGMEEPEVIGETADAPFLVAWDTSAYADGEYMLQAIAMSSEENPLMTATITVEVSNASADEADIIEDNGSKIETIDTDEDQVVVTSDGVIVELPAGTLAADDRLIIAVVDAVDASGILPGESTGMIVDITTESGQRLFDTDITIRIPYADDDQDGILDGTTIAETTLTIWFFDGADWLQFLDTEVLPDDNVVVGQTDHLTEFGAFSTSTEADRPASTTRPVPDQGQAGSGGGSGSCFIATAAFGSPLEPRVMVLRKFRDAYLLTNKPGRWFVAQYYQLSPPLADFIRGHDNLRALVRVGLIPLVWTGRFMMQSTGTQKLALTVIILLCGVSMVWVLRCFMRRHGFIRRPPSGHRAGSR